MKLEELICTGWYPRNATTFVTKQWVYGYGVDTKAQSSQEVLQDP